MKFKNLSLADCSIKDIDAFKKLSSNDLTVFEQNRTCSLQSKGMILYREGNRINGFYCVHKGIVKLFKTGVNGKEQILKFVKKGEIFGYRSIIAREVACTTAKIVKDAVLSYIPATTLLELTKTNAAFSNAVLHVACLELEEANKAIMNLAQKTVKERLAEVLILLKKDFEVDNTDHLQITLTREELANMIGTATESVIRLLAEFKAKELIEVEGRKIRILKEDALIKMSKLYE